MVKGTDGRVLDAKRKNIGFILSVERSHLGVLKAKVPAVGLYFRAIPL